MKPKWVIYFFLFVCPMLMLAQQVNHLEAAKKAVVVFNAAYKAESSANFERLEQLYFGLSGTNVNPRQAYDLTTHPGSWPNERVLNYWFYHFKNRQFRNYSMGMYNGGHDLSFEELNIRDTSYYITTQMRKYLPFPNDFESSFDALKNVPGLFLLKAKAAIKSVTRIDDGQIGDVPVVIIEIDWSGKRTRLYVNRSTHKLEQISWLAKDLITGTRLNVLRYSDHKYYGEFELPSRVQYYIDGRLRQDLHLSVFNPSPDFSANLFKLETDLTRFEHKPWSIEQVSQNTYEIKGLSGSLYTIPFVVLDDGIVVYDAIRNPGLFGKAINLIENQFKKPVRHVILSHNHQDHIGGIRAVINKPVEILSTAKTKLRLEDLMAPSGSVYEGSNIDRPEHKYTVILVDDEYIIDSEYGSVTIYNVGATPHVDDLLYAVVQPDNVVIQADSYFGFSPWNAIFDFFEDWIINMGLESSIITGTHMDPVPFKSLISEIKPGQLNNFIPEYLTEMNLYETIKTGE